jgi:hypothetical protein
MIKVLSAWEGPVIWPLGSQFPVFKVFGIALIRPLLRGYSCQNAFGVAFLAPLVPGVEVA